MKSSTRAQTKTMEFFEESVELLNLIIQSIEEDPDSIPQEVHIQTIKTTNKLHELNTVLDGEDYNDSN